LFACQRILFAIIIIIYYHLFASQRILFAVIIIIYYYLFACQRILFVIIIIIIIMYYVFASQRILCARASGYPTTGVAITVRCRRGHHEPLHAGNVKYFFLLVKYFFQAGSS